MSTSPRPLAVVVGGGPAGLMAAETIASNGFRVEVYDAMPSVGRKFLMAGKGGMNITHAEPFDNFVSRYGSRSDVLRPMLDAFGPQQLREWIHGLGIETFVGTSGRVFPTEMKAAPLLRAWLHRLRTRGVQFHVRHRWIGWDNNGDLRFTSPDGEVSVQTDATVLALGGASWPQLGSDGRWVATLQEQGCELARLRPSNCGFEIDWSEHFRQRYAGEPLKSVAASVVQDDQAIYRRGECLITEHGIEGGLVYALSAPLRDQLELRGAATLTLDLLPDMGERQVLANVTHPRGSRSLSSHLQSRLKLQGAKAGLLREVLSPAEMSDLQLLARTIKALPLRLKATRPLTEAISTAGGVTFESLNEQLMLKHLPGVFCSGEMLDWEAPTGGYLLTACFASGRMAGLGAAERLRSVEESAIA